MLTGRTRADFFAAVEREMDRSVATYPGNTKRFTGFCQEAGEVLLAWGKLEITGSIHWRDNLREELAQAAATAGRLWMEGDAALPSTVGEPYPKADPPPAFVPLADVVRPRLTPHQEKALAFLADLADRIRSGECHMMAIKNFEQPQENDGRVPRAIHRPWRLAIDYVVRETP